MVEHLELLLVVITIARQDKVEVRSPYRVIMLDPIVRPRRARKADDDERGIRFGRRLRLGGQARASQPQHQGPGDE